MDLVCTWLEGQVHAYKIRLTLKNATQITLTQNMSYFNACTWLKGQFHSLNISLLLKNATLRTIT